jgi:hypothetical protein
MPESQPPVVALELVAQSGLAESTFRSMVTTTVGFFIGLLLVYLGVQSYRKHAVVKNTGTATVRSAALGQAKLRGTVRPASYLVDQPVTDAECVYAEWTDEGQRRDADGEVTVRHPPQSGREGVPFYLEADGERILVDDPTDATVATDGTEPSWDDELGLFSRLVLAMGPGGIGSRGSETKTLTTGTEVYAFGWLSECDDPPGTERTDYILERDERTGKFIISDRDELGLASYLERLSRRQILAGISVSALCLGYWGWIATAEGLSFALEATAYGTVISVLLYGPWLLFRYLFRERW